MNRVTAEILSEPEAARLLRVSARTLRLWRSQRQGPPYIKLGDRFVRYSRNSVLEWAKAREHNPEAGRGRN